MADNKLTKTAVALALAVSAMSAQAASLPLITNGSFEITPSPVDSGSWEIFGSISGWVGDPAGVEVRNNAVGRAQNGSNFVELDTTRNSTITQLITGTTAGQEYTLSFYYSPRIGRTVPEDNRIEVFWNNRMVRMVEGVGGTDHQWKEYLVVLSGAFVGASNTLKFAAAGNLSNSFGGSLDNVSLTATPLPGAALLFGTSIAGFLAARKRRKAGALAA